MVYKALLKHYYYNSKLSIIEICNCSNLIRREEYCLDLLKSEHNILKMVGSLLEFKHNRML